MGSFPTPFSSSLYLPGNTCPYAQLTHIALKELGLFDVTTRQRYAYESIIYLPLSIRNKSDTFEHLLFYYLLFYSK